MKARYFKVQAHKIFPGYDAFIWMDGNIQIKNSTFVAEMMAALQEASIAIARHPSRDCIYDEAKFVTDGIRNGSNYLSARYDPVSISWQVAEYSNAGHPAHFGLWWCGLFARRVNERVNRFFDRWWNECLCWSNNDQISFAYLAERLNLEINSIAWGDFNENATYKRHHHLLVQ
jgi:hypothetical protein